MTRFLVCSFFAGSLVLAASASALPQSAARFGRSVSSADVNGDGFADVIVGEPGFDGNAADEGRVLVFHGSSSGPSSTPNWTRRGLQARAHFGATVVGLGDVNGDGFGDVAVGAPDFDAPRPRLLAGPGAAQLVRFRDSGALAVFLGSPSGLPAAPALFRPGIDHEEHLGSALARAGDVNGDGFDDVLVGASGTDNGVGAAFVFLGSASGPEPVPHWIGQPAQHEQGTGYARALAGGGDVNNDGFDDVVVGASGSALAYYGSASGLAPSASWTLPLLPEGDGPFTNGNSDWGAALALGNMNGDGFHDLLIANPNYDGDTGHGSGQQIDTGIVFVFRGTSSGIGSFARRDTGSTGGAHQGTTLAVVGDVSGDGRDDALFIEPGRFFQNVRYGNAQNFLNGSSLIAGTLSSWEGGSFGESVSAGGDIDGDGRFDLLIGDPSIDFDVPDEGVVYVYRGVAGEVSLSAEWILMAP